MTVTEYLRQHGPMKAADLAARLSMPVAATYALLIPAYDAGEVGIDVQRDRAKSDGIRVWFAREE